MDEIIPEKIILTVTGKDNLGVVSAVLNFLAENKINVEDIKQTIMFKNFVMIITCNLKTMNISFGEFRENIKYLAKEINMEIAIQNTSIASKILTH